MCKHPSKALTVLRIDGILILLSKRGQRGRLGVVLRTGWPFCILAALAFVLSACGAFGGTSSIDDIGLTTALNADYCPVDEVTTFPVDRAFYCSVQVSNLRAGSTVTSRWYFGEQFIEEINYEVQSGGFGCVGFELATPNHWPKGGYRVEVYLDGHLERSATFAVS